MAKALIATHVVSLTMGVWLLIGNGAAAQQPPSADTLRSVTLSLTEYNRLIDLAGRPAPAASVPPVAAVVAAALLRVRVEGDGARGVFDLTGDVLRSGVHRVALISNATLVAATSAGRPLPLVAEGPAHAALISGPAPFTATLEWGTPLAIRPGRASFLLPVPAAGTARATIDLPGEQADVRLSAGLVTRRSSAGGRTIVEATLDPGSSTEVSWSLRDSAPVAAVREVRTTADVLTQVTIGDSDVRMVALVDVAVVQGEPRTIDVRLPAGYEVLGISGSSISTSEPRPGGVLLTIGDLVARRHQFLISLERPYASGVSGLDTELVSLPGTQRERGEISIEGVGTLELVATERPGMHRIDVRELHRSLHSLARLPILSAFRYQRSATVIPGLTLSVERFPDAGVLAAVADHAVATTLVTTEGRALTEIVLQIQNRAQSFLKVSLPPDATIFSVEVAGQSAKPVLGADGTRVPLLRPGFRPSGPYEVSFVYLHAGTPFSKKGEMQMALPRMDLPVGMVSWEVFVPDRYNVRRIGGNVIDSMTPWDVDRKRVAGDRPMRSGVIPGGIRLRRPGADAGSISGGVTSPGPGQLRGRVFDASGAPLPGAVVQAAGVGGTRRSVADEHGTFTLSDVPTGPVTVSATLPGFAPQSRAVVFSRDGLEVDIIMPVGPLEESISLSAAAPSAKQAAEPSQNVINLQQRAAGVLPVRVDVPRAGSSHSFSKPLVIDQETTVTFRYRQR